MLNCKHQTSLAISELPSETFWEYQHMALRYIFPPTLILQKTSNRLTDPWKEPIRVGSTFDSSPLELQTT